MPDHNTDVAPRAGDPARRAGFPIPTPIRGTAEATRSADNQISLFIITLLLIIFCQRIWGLGLTTTDDAFWALWAHQPAEHPVSDFARGQGRFWVFGAGTWLLYALRHAATLYGDVLVVGSFVLFFILFVRVVAVYWSAPMAFTTAGIFLACSVIRADRSILNAYPLFFWVPAAAALGAALAARRYQHRGGWIWLAVCGLLFLLALFNNEGALVLTLVAAPLALTANYWQCPAHEKIECKSRTRTAFSAIILTASAFIAASFAWRLSHPSLYPGNTLAPFDLHRISETLFNFVTSGTIIYDFLHPYTQLYTDVLAQRNDRITYTPERFLHGAGTDTLAVIAAGLVFFLIIRQLLPSATPTQPTWRAAASAAGVGGLIAVLPLVPVAMTTQYQNWFYQHDAHAYSHTVFATFGLALLASIFIHYLSHIKTTAISQRCFALLIATFLSFSALVSHRMNDAIARDMRPEAGRWRVMRAAAELLQSMGSGADVVFMPRLRSGSWFAAVPPHYWSEYMRDVLRRPIRITDRGITRSDIAAGAAYADFRLAQDGRHFIVTAAQLAPLAAAQPASGAPAVVAARIGVILEAPEELLSTGLILSYRDVNQNQHSVPIRTLQRISSRIRVLSGIHAIPESITIQQQSSLPPLFFSCDSVSTETVLTFSDAPTSDTSACYAGSYLRTGWWPAEPGGTWSIQSPSAIRIPAGGLPPGNIRMFIDASTSAAQLGLSEIQTVRVLVNGHIVAVRTSARTLSADPPIIIPQEVWHGRPDLSITLEVSPLISPAARGLGSDTRSLGLYLRSIYLRPGDSP